jgi:hypothetical protein
LKKRYRLQCVEASTISEDRALIREGFSCPSKETVEEMMSFVVKPDGKAQAEESCFDDRIIASAIAVSGSQDVRNLQVLSER